MKPLTPIAFAGFAALAIGTGTAHADGIQLQPTTTVDQNTQAAGDIDTTLPLIPNCALGSGLDPIIRFQPFLQGGIGSSLGSVNFTTTTPTCSIIPPLPLPGLGYLSLW